MLTLASWWHAAEHLEEGRSVRVPHDCGEGRQLIVSRNLDGYRAWCFRCNDGGGADPPAVSLADKLARIDRQRRGDTSLCEQAGFAGLPVEAVRDVSRWPNDAAVWLYKAGLGRAEIGRLGIYYHPPSDRVVLPVFEGTEPVFWQARAYQRGRAPKYLGPTPRPPRLLARWGRASVPTITEDILSAMKVGLVAEGWSAMGTRISDHMLAELLKRGGKANVWLDPDAAGRKGAAKIVKQLRGFGIETRNILSERDPKLHTRDEIKEILG